MLAYILAIAVGLASLTLYLAALFAKDLHRQDDFLWSGLGLFYALVLWVCAGRLTGGVLLGQAAAATLILSFGWQTLKLRRAIAHPEEQASLEGFSWLGWLQDRLGRKAPSVPAAPEPEAEAAESLPAVEEPEAKAPEGEETAPISETTAEAGAEPEAPPQKGFSWKNLFPIGRSPSTPQLEAEEEGEPETPGAEAAEVDLGSEPELPATPEEETVLEAGETPPEPEPEAGEAEEGSVPEPEDKSDGPPQPA